MATQGRALDIRVIGLGQAGGNLAAEFHRRGYPALAFNTARTDLSALAPDWGGPGLDASSRIYIGIAGFDGAGADPDYGRSCVAEHAELILGRAREHSRDADLIIVTAGLGGGTGSSVQELVNVLSELSVPVVCLVTLPSESESGIAKVNAVRAINELLEHELDGWIIVDNARLASRNQDVVARRYFTNINEQIIAPLDDFNRLNERSSVHAIRAFDGEDFRKVLLAGGLIHYEVVELSEDSLSPNSIIDAINNSLDDGTLMPAGFDRANISSIALVVETSEATLNKTPMHVFDQLTEELKRSTEGAAVDIGLYQQNSGDKTTLRMMSVSRGLPARIQDVVSSARDEGRILSDKMHERLPSLELGDIADLDLFGKGTKRRNIPRRATQNTARRPEIAPTSTRKENYITSTAYSPSGMPTARKPSIPAASPSLPPPGRPSRPPAAASSPPSNPPQMKEGARHISTPPPLPVKDPAKGVADPPEPKKEIASPEVKESSKTGKRKTKGSKKNTEALPNAEVYDELVESFRRNKDEKVRLEIAQQLENDFDSEHAVVRFYAIDAMAKLDRKRFEGNLLAATEDENTAVRKIAKAALQR